MALKQALWKMPANSSRPMMAKMMMRNITSNMMLNRGIMAIMIALMTICKPEGGESYSTYHLVYFCETLFLNFPLYHHDYISVSGTMGVAIRGLASTVLIARLVLTWMFFYISCNSLIL